MTASSGDVEPGPCPASQTRELKFCPSLSVGPTLRHPRIDWTPRRQGSPARSIETSALSAHRQIRTPNRGGVAQVRRSVPCPSWSSMRPSTPPRPAPGCTAPRARVGPHQWIQPIGLTPAEPAPELVGVQLMGVPCIPRQEGSYGQLSRRHRHRREGQELRRREPANAKRVQGARQAAV
jgi:hypothetical protein